MHRYRIAFLGGLAAGFVVGARAGRERYDQIKKLARSAAAHPAVQQAAGALQAQTAGLAKAATQRVSAELRDRVPGMGRSGSPKPDAAQSGPSHRDGNGNAEMLGNQPVAHADGRGRKGRGQ